MRVKVTSRNYTHTYIFSGGVSSVRPMAPENKKTGDAGQKPKTVGAELCRPPAAYSHNVNNWHTRGSGEEKLLYATKYKLSLFPG